MTSYATMDDLLSLFETPPKDGRRPRLEGLLEVATQELIEECGGRDFFRHPTTGTRTWTVDGDGCDVLHFHEGLVDVSSLEISLDSGVTFEALEAGHYQLMGVDPDSDFVPAGEPYFHLRLLHPPIGIYSSFPRGRSTVRFVGATGWPAPAAVLVEATAERARQLAYADPSYSGSIPGPDEYADSGTGAVSDRWPQLLWNFLRNQRLRFYACSM